MPKLFAEKGSVAIEYLIISIFGLVVSMTAATYLGRVFHKKITAMSEKFDLEVDEDLSEEFQNWDNR